MDLENIKDESFLENYAKPYVKSLEKRRLNYLKKFKIYLLISFVIISTLLLAEPFISSTMDSIAKTFHNIKYSNNLAYKNQSEFLKTYIYIFIPLISLIFAIMPIFNYRRNANKKSEFSIKESTFNHLLKYFGEFTFKREHRSIRLDSKQWTILPEYDDHHCEDSINGVFHDSKIEISEIRLFKQRGNKKNGKKVSVFSGLMVVIHFCNSNLALRNPFRGETIIMQEDKKDLGYIKEKFKNYEKIDLPNQILEDRFEGFTTNKKEAKIVANEELLNSILELCSIINAPTKQKTRLDDKIMFFAYQNAQFLGSLFLQFLLIPFSLFNLIRGRGFSLDWYFEDLKFSKHADIYKTTSDNGKLQAINSDLTCSFNGNKVLITIPNSNDLFEPHSIFKPVFTDQDLDLLSKIMNMINKITGQICENKNS
ncbi:MAG: hypothetical protein ACJAS6_000777 [Rickettsiales bacterium]|jgi:hypothetical protein